MSRDRIAPRRLALALAACGCAALPLAAGGCFVTRAEGDQMQSQIDQLKQQMDANEAQWATAVKSYQDEVAKLHATLAKASELLARNSANVGQQVQDLQMSLAQAKGELDDLGHAMQALQKQLAEYVARNDNAVATLTKIVTAPPASQPVLTADGLFEQSYKEYSQKKYDAARKDFRTFLLKFPFDPRAANAQFWIADAFFQEANYAGAIPEYQKVVDNYPSSDVADQAWFKEGHAFFQVKWCTPALAYLTDLPRKYPSSSELADARKLVKDIRRAQRKGECTR